MAYLRTSSNTNAGDGKDSYHRQLDSAVLPYYLITITYYNVLVLVLSLLLRLLPWLEYLCRTHQGERQNT